MDVFFFYPVEVCTGGKVWTGCVSQCQPTCQSHDETCDAFGGCKAGCACPVGLVNHNGTCISKTECPCFHNGKAYSEGKSISSGCNSWYILFSLFRVRKSKEKSLWWRYI